MKKKRKTATQLSDIDLRLMFLAELRREAPEAIYDLDATKDISKWASKYGLNATWIHTIANWMIDSRQGQIDRLDLSVDPLGNALFLDEGAEPLDEYQRRVLANWDKAVEHQTVFLRGGEKFFADNQMGELAPVVATKRDAQTHCKMLVFCLVFDLTDDQIAERVKYRDASNVGLRLREMANLLEIELPSRAGRPKKTVV